MRYLALTLAFSFAVSSMEAATRRSSTTHQVKAKKPKNVKPRKGKHAVKPAVHKAN